MSVFLQLFVTPFGGRGHGPGNEPEVLLPTLSVVFGGGATRFIHLKAIVSPSTSVLGGGGCRTNSEV